MRKILLLVMMSLFVSCKAKKNEVTVGKVLDRFAWCKQQASLGSNCNKLILGQIISRLQDSSRYYTQDSLLLTNLEAIESYCELRSSRAYGRRDFKIEDECIYVELAKLYGEF
jgi:hypothetical protein